MHFKWLRKGCAIFDRDLSTWFVIWFVDCYILPKPGPVFLLKGRWDSYLKCFVFWLQVNTKIPGSTWMTSGWCLTTPGCTTARLLECTSTALNWLRFLNRRLTPSCRASATVAGGRWDRGINEWQDRLEWILVGGFLVKEWKGLRIKGGSCL